MAQETVDIFETIAKGTVTLGELKAALSDAKKALDGMNVGEEKYQQQLKDVITLQNAVRGAMNGTTASLEDVAKAADGTAKTYNGLVNQMANMKRELRNIDVSTEEGAKAFEDLAKKISAVNDELKAMDAQKGDFQRNVGNYTGALKSWASGADALDKGLKSASGGVNGLKGSMEALAANPAMATIGILVSVAMKLAESLKDNESAMAGLKKAMDALKPVTDFFAGVLDTIGTYLGDLISKVSVFISSSGIFQKVIQGVVGVGNAIVQFIAAPVKGVIAAIKVFQDEGVKGLRNAGKAFAAEMKSGVAFKSNYEAGQLAADGFLMGASSKKKDAERKGAEIGKAVKDGVEKELTADDLAKIFEQALAKAERKASERRKEIAEKDSLIDSLADQMDAELTAEVDAYLDAERVMYETSVKMAEEAAAKKMAVMSAYASGTSDLLSGIADLMEESGQADEASVKAAKNLRIAAATIDMISGAVTAFSTAQSLGPIAGPIVGAINAAAVVASGLANIAKIKATTVSKDASPNQSAPETPQATVAAPALAAAVPTTTIVNGASTEAALNRAAQPQKVYILQSDIEAANDASQVQVAESSF